jgi:anti-sigma regulatory factor (Ser/Thr protein kinase)
VYGSDEDLRARVLPYLRAGLDRGDEVVAVVTERAELALRAGLGRDGDAVQWRAPGVSYHRIGQLLEGIRAFLAPRSTGETPIRLLMENDIDGDPDRQTAHLRVEAAANDLFAVYGCPCTCLYDRGRYPGPVLDAVARVHPLILGPDGASRVSVGYLEPGTFLTAHAGPLTPVPAEVALDVRCSGPAELRALRRRIVDTGHTLGLPARECGDLLLAANEAATNALRHGVPPARIRVWRGERSVTARIDDQGTSGQRAAAAGYHPPASTERAGLGLWVARQLADIVHVAAGPHGTSIELQFWYPR